MNRNFTWRSGNGEVIGFVTAIFILAIVTLGIIGFMNYTIHSQQLSVATYLAGRAAVVSQDESFANQRATAVINAMYQNTAGATQTSAGYAWIDHISPPESGWVVGNIVTVTAHQHLGAVLPFFTERDISWSIAMMIEAQPEDELLSY